MFEKVEKVIMSAHKKIDRLSTELFDLRYEVRSYRNRPMYAEDLSFEISEEN